jgi:D-alanyl-D-alanine carboxypeptidase (penicillin-binding protein 5/6)
VVNGLPDIAERAAEAERLLKYGFLNFRNLRVVKKNQVLANVPVWMGKAKTISLMASEDLIITLPREQQKNVTLSMSYETPIKAPIKINDKIGELSVTLPGSFSHTFPILANKDVPKLPYLKIIFVNLRNAIFGKKNK